MANRLGSARSPYLRSAAGQPVHWHEWGTEAFERAGAENKPVLLDIGAVWCHWCHVMDSESYEDPQVAAELNRHFVCVKVDRDERPDVDTRYQRAVQGLSGQGGWPLTAFLTPSGDVFFGGTYFPPDGRHGRPGFLSVLRQVGEIYRSEPGRVGAQAEQVRRFVEEQLDQSAGGEPDLGLLRRAVRRILAFADRTHGGFGGAPKFPHPAGVQLLLARWATEGAPALREVAVEALDAMALGGIRDQVGGGFHRYGTDERWIIPHFEKMSYDNSELLRLYADAARALDSPLYREVAADTLRWVRDVLGDNRGGSGASQDADLGPGDDGGYFTWSLAQLDRALDPLEAKVAIVRFGVGTLGRMHHDASQNVLFVAEPIEAVAERVGLSPGDTEEHLARALAKLRAARAERPAPAVDRTRYAGWNAMMAAAVARAGLVLDDGAAVAEALTTLRDLAAAQDDRANLAHSAGGVTGLLDDQVATAAAALDAFEATGDPDWLDWARELMHRAIATCWDPAEGGFFDRPPVTRATGLLAARAKPIQDGPTPSGNGLAGIVLARLHGATHDPLWDQYHRRLLAAFAGRAEELGLFAATYFIALDWAVAPVTHLLITGPADSAAAAAMHQAALASWLPRRVVTRITPETASRLAAAPALAPTVGDPEETRGYLCVGTRCLEPATDPAGWADRLERAITAVRDDPAVVG